MICNFDCMLALEFPELVNSQYVSDIKFCWEKHAPQNPDKRTYADYQRQMQRAVYDFQNQTVAHDVNQKMQDLSVSPKRL